MCGLKSASLGRASHPVALFMARGQCSARPAPCSAIATPAPCSGSASNPRKSGQVRQSQWKSCWIARFRFGQQGTLTSTFDGPFRIFREDAERDCTYAAACMDEVPRPSKVSAASRAVQMLRDGKARPSGQVPGSASSALRFDAESLQNMSKLELRNLATRTPGIVRDKKTQKGKWVPKSCQELKAELLAMKTNTSTQAVPGRPTAKKRPASTF